MSERPIIAVDAMGGDFGPSVLIPGALEASRTDDLKVLLVGDTERIKAVLATTDTKGADYDIVQADEVVLMNERPADVLRRKKKSSIQIGCNLVREKAADAVVSAGHSGAAVACGMFTIGRLHGVERPALCTILPTEKTPEGKNHGQCLTDDRRKSRRSYPAAHVTDKNDIKNDIRY